MPAYVSNVMVFGSTRLYVLVVQIAAVLRLQHLQCLFVWLARAKARMLQGIGIL